MCALSFFDTPPHHFAEGGALLYGHREAAMACCVMLCYTVLCMLNVVAITKMQG